MRFNVALAGSILSVALATKAIAADGGVVTLSFYKDSCETFLQSEPADQEMYLWWATSGIKKELADSQKPIGSDIEAASTWLRNYCAAHPTTAFVDAAAAAKAQLLTSEGMKR